MSPTEEVIASGEASSLGDNVTCSRHPVLSHKITVLRKASTPPGTFRSVLREVTYHLGYESTSELVTKPMEISVSSGKKKPALPSMTNTVDSGSVTSNESGSSSLLPATGRVLSDRTAVIPILRSGLGMSDAMLELLPNSAVYHIGMYHNPGCAPVQYFNRLPRKCTSDVAFVLDPVIASSATIMAVIGMLKKWGVPKIHVLSVLASRPGLKTLADAHPDVHIHVGVIDNVLTDDGLVLPGMGDAGDRLFGTPTVAVAEEDPNADLLDDDTTSAPATKRQKT